MIVLLIAGIAAFTAGILALGFGVPIKEFSFGNTMIITGAIVASAGLLLIGMWVVGRELRAIARRFEASELPALPRAAATASAPPVMQARASEPEPVVIGDITAPPRVEEPEMSPSWSEPEPPAPEPAPAPKPKRNLLFSSSSRKERERAAAKAAEKAAEESKTPPSPEANPAELAPDVSPPAPDIDPRASFEAAWPQAERARPGGMPLRREESVADLPAVPPVAPPPRVRPDPKPLTSEITILKSGVVDGMAYSLYSDGSIEAQMPEGMVRFASIDELRAHLDQRP